MSGEKPLPRGVQIWQSLDKNERRRFRQRLKMYRSSRSKRLNKLTELLDTVSPERYFPRALFRSLHGTRSFSEGAWNDELSDLTEEVEALLVADELDRRPAQRSHLLRHVLRQRGLTDHAGSRLREAQQPGPEWSSQGLLFDYLHGWEDFEQRHAARRQDGYVADLRDLARRLDTVYALERGFLEIIYEDRYSALVPTRVANRTEEPLELPTDTVHPTVEAVRLLLDQYRTYNSDREARLFVLLPQVIERSNNRTGSRLIWLINNLLHRQLKQHPDLGYHQPIFQFFRSGLDRGFLLRNGIITPSTYLNTVNLGLRNHEDNWVETFLKTFTPRLPPKYRTEVQRLARAQLHLFRNELTEAETALTEPFRELTLALRSRSKILHLYYLQSLNNAVAHDRLIDSLERFRWWLQKLRKIDYARATKEDYFEIASVLEEVLEVRASGTKTEAHLRADALRKRVEKKEVVLPDWLRRVVNHL